jgi:hypothetical protein
MLTISHSGPSIAQAIAAVQGAPTTLVPYAAATALTRCAKYAQATALPAAMRKAFDGTTPWTLNSLRIEPASKDKLSARVLVKNQAGAGAVAQEKYLQPEVQGGQRGHKRLENALRYQGILSTGQFAMPGAGMTLDANGNVKGAEVRTILNSLKGIRAASATRDRKTGKRLAKGRQLKNDLFVGKPNGGNRPDGIWRREGHRLRALFVFTTGAPDYRQRLDFTGVVQQVALERFRPEFEKAVAAQVAKGWK